MRSETKEIRYFFNKLALDWDKKESKKTFENIKKIISLIKINTFENVLDVGCGTGVCFPYLTRKFKNYIGIDLSDKMIEIAKTKYPCANFINGDFYKHKFKKNHFDLVMAFNSFPHFEKKKIFLKKAKEILKKNGKIVIAHGMPLEKINKIHKNTNSRIKKHTITSKEILKLFKKTGFKNIKMIENDYFYIEGEKV